MKVGDIFIFRKAMSWGIYHRLDGSTGLILAMPTNRANPQYKVAVGNKILWIPIQSIEKIDKKV